MGRLQQQKVDDWGEEIPQLKSGACNHVQPLRTNMCVFSQFTRLIFMPSFTLEAKFGNLHPRRALH